MRYDAYHIIYREPNKSFRQSSSELLRSIANFSSEYFVLTDKYSDGFYDMLLKYAKIFISANVNQIKKNQRFSSEYDDLIMHTYLVLMPIDAITGDLKKAFALLTEDYPDNLYEMSSDIAIVEKTVVEIPW